MDEPPKGDVFRCRFCKGEGGYAWLCTHRCEAEAIAQEWSSGDTLFTPEQEDTDG